MSANSPIDGHIQKIRASTNDGRRLGAVNKSGLINTEEEESFDRLTRLASKLLQIPVSFVTVLEKDRDFVKSHFGLPSSLAESREITAHPSFCQHIVDSGQPLILEDARDSEIFRHFPSVQHLGVVAYAGIPLTTKQGFVLGTFCVVDFKKRIWTEDEIEILVELSRSVLTEIELRQAASALEEFVLIAAHEIRTPLACMKSYTQILQHQILANNTENLKKDVLQIDDQIDHLDLLVNRLFDINAIKKGEVHLQKGDFDLILLITDAVRYFENQLPQKFVLTFSQPTLFINADKNRILQVLTNLISNASKYAPLTDKIEINVSQKDKDVIVSVKDYGRGISEADSKKIFNRFYRVQGDTKTIGLGLGLYICKDIIEAHNGTLNVQSELGVATIFSFSLPLQPQV